MSIDHPRLLCLLGPPGAGKTSQGAALAGLLDGRHISAGELVRQANAAGEKVPRDRKQPGLADPDWMIARILTHAGSARLLIVDGYPRAPSHLDGLMTLGRVCGAIRVQVDLDEAIDRMRIRRRTGETLARIASRWNQHRNREGTVVEEFANRAIPLIDVDGQGDRAQVTQRVYEAALQLMG